MTVTFLVAINIDDITPGVLTAIAGELSDDLTATGYDVESVAPWQRPSLAMQLPQQTAPPLQPPSL